uniref:G_PROTEIN_RECEP_F1_2 domain-containing protein n=1 Tax=Rhabditophanes sp. KR3021 TaxID=114890 RepID=A0AC35TK29_9BILA
MSLPSNTTINLDHVSTSTLTPLLSTTTSLLEFTTTTVTNVTHHFIRTECFQNLSTLERYEISQRRRAVKLEEVFRVYYGWMALPINLIATVLTVLFLLSVYRAIKQQRVSRKCYVLLFNRSIGDLVCCISNFGVIGYVLLAHRVNRDIVPLIDTFFTGAFWSATVSYVALSLLKLYAVARPFEYRRKVNMRRVIHLIIFSWIVFLAMIIYAFTVTALVKIPSLNEWSGCKMETCLRLMYRSRNWLTIIVYFFTLAVFFCTLLYIRKARKFVSSFHKKDKEGNSVVNSRFPFWKLALNVGTFAGMNGFYIVWAIGLQINSDQCFFQRNFAPMMRVLSFVRLTLLLRICVDPILTFITDFQMRRSLYGVLGINGTIQPLNSQKNMINKGSSRYVSNSSEDLDRTNSATNKSISNNTNSTRCPTAKSSQHKAVEFDVIEVADDTRIPNQIGIKKDGNTRKST